jgi:predicted lysophospholipase L1 biosynthesis ABC-type transport system permease subunit
LYAPYAQHDQIWQSWMTVVARVRQGMDPSVVEDGMLAALSEIDPRLPARGVGTVEELYEFGARPLAFAMTLAVTFALVALTLCVLGLYGLVSYSVAARRREIGLRMALGADHAAVVIAVLVRCLLLAGAGGLIGLAVALLATRPIEGMLFGVEPTDGPTYVATLVLVLLVAAVAAGVPAWRASRMDPFQSLASE